SEPDNRTVEVIGIGALDLHAGHLADPQRAAAVQVHHAVDLRRVALAAALGAWPSVVDDDFQPAADLALEAGNGDRALGLHEAMPALLLDFFRHRFGQRIGGRAVHGLVAEAADAIELRLLQPIQQQAEILLGLAREADDEGRAKGDVRTDL